MSKGVQSALEVVGAVALLVVTDGASWQQSAALLATAFATERSARQEISARNAYNASQRDRYAMMRSSTAGRQLVFGRARVSGPMFFAASYGTDNTHLTICVALAAHEVDAIETVYFDDHPVTLDGSGNVIGVQLHDSFSIAAPTATVTIEKTPRTGTIVAQARYGDDIVPLTVTSVSGAAVSVSGARSAQTGQLDVYYTPDPDPYAPSELVPVVQSFIATSATQTFTLPSTLDGEAVPAPDSSSVHANYQETQPDAQDGYALTVTGVSGYNVTVTGLDVGRTVLIYYQFTRQNSKCRVRKYTGAPGQAADAGMIANLPGVWTSAHTATGIAYLVVELDYDQDAFISGVPSISAVVRGMKCYDPRTSATAWTENTALHARALATHPLAGNLATSLIDDAAVVVAANICDTTATYTLGSVAYTRPLYTSSYTHSADSKATDGLTDLCQAMGGKWIWSDGQFRLFAGAYVTPNPMVLDETWLSDDQPPTVQNAIARSSLVNTVTGSISDEYQEYRVVPLAKLAPSAYVAEDGATLAQNIQYAAISFAGQAQYVSSCMMRRQRQGMTIKLRCNYRAWQVQAGDTQLVTLSRFGWAAKPFEVIQDSWTADGSIELVLQEVDASIWNMDAGFSATDPAPNTSLPAPWGLPSVTSLAASSGDSSLLRQADGTVVPQILVTWDAITDSRVLQGGYVEIRYWRTGAADNTFLTVRAQPGDTQALLPGVIAGQPYLIMARTGSVVTQSPWSRQISVVASSKTAPPSNVNGLAAAIVYGAVSITWSQPPDADYLQTELRVGATWAAGTPLRGSTPTTVRGVSYLWPWPNLGSYTVWAKHYDTSGNQSATATSAAVIVDSSINLGTGQLGPNAATNVYVAPHVATGSWSSSE